MRLTSTLLPAVLLVACGRSPAASESDASTGDTDAQTSSDATESSAPTTDTTGNPTLEPTGGSITGGMTEGLTSTTGTDSTDGTDSTSPVVTDTAGMTDTDSTDSTDSTVGMTSTSTGDTSTGDTTDASSSDTGDDSTTGEEACVCPDIEVPLDDGIFVLAQDAALWKYFPEDNSLVMLGVPQCDLPPSTFSMAVDRAGFAWLQYASGELRKVAVSDLDNCIDPGFVPIQQGIFNFGMAFVSNSESDKCDRIYGDEYNGISEGDDVSVFFSIDPVTQKIMPLGTSDFGTAEVTGTGDGRVFLFAPAALSKLVEIDKATGDTISSIPLPGITAGSGWAFAFFAGDFYFFTDGENDGASEVTHIDYDDSNNDGKQEITVVIDDAPLRVVGAGVSTCAPTLPQ